MNKYLGFKQFFVLLLPLSFYSAASTEQSEVSLSLWADMAVNCQKLKPKKNYHCQLSANKRILYLGFKNEIKSEVDGGKDIGKKLGLLAITGGYALPFLFFMEREKVTSVNAKSHKLLRNKVEQIEHPQHLEIQTFVDGLQMHSVKTDESGMFNLDVKQDSVVSFYAVYEKRALVLQQDIYLN